MKSIIEQGTIAPHLIQLGLDRSLKSLRLPHDGGINKLLLLTGKNVLNPGLKGSNFGFWMLQSLLH